VAPKLPTNPEKFGKRYVRLVATGKSAQNSKLSEKEALYRALTRFAQTVPDNGKVRKFPLRFVGLMLIFWLLQPALAFSQSHEEEGREIVRKSLVGWKGITFRCSPDAENDAFLDGICRDVRAEARLLAATGNIPFHDLTGSDYFALALDSTSNDFFVLETRLRTTRGGDDRAVYMEIEARAYYSEAVEQNAGPDKPQGKPRSGDLVFFSDDLIGSGPPGPDLAQALTSAMSTRLKDFFSLVIESRNR